MCMTYYTVDDLRPGRPGWDVRQFSALAEAIDHYRALPMDGIRVLGMADEFIGVGIIHHTKDTGPIHGERPVMVDGLRQCRKLPHIPSGSSGAEIVHGVIGHAHSDILLTSYSCRP